MNITIAGAGNIGTQFAVHCAEKNHNVTVYTSKPEKISKDLMIVDENGREIHRGQISNVTGDEGEAFENADIIFVTMPAFCMDAISQKIYPYVHKGLMICLVPGTGGGEFAFKKCIDRGAGLFGMQRVPSVARLIEYGKTVEAVGYRKELYVAALPECEVAGCADILNSIFDMECKPLPNYLTLTLTPSNPILHPSRLRTIFGEYRDGVIYDSLPLFYEDWDDKSSELLLRCDDEVQDICRRFEMFDLTYVKSLRVHYESFDAHSMTRKISGIKAFKGLKTPSVKVDGGYIPDFSSRYFRSDFSLRKRWNGTEV